MDSLGSETILPVLPTFIQCTGIPWPGVRFALVPPERISLIWDLILRRIFQNVDERLNNHRRPWYFMERKRICSQYNNLWAINVMKAWCRGTLGPLGAACSVGDTCCIVSCFQRLGRIYCCTRDPMGWAVLFPRITREVPLFDSLLLHSLPLQTASHS